MRKIIIATLILFPQLIQAQEDRRVESKIKEVTIFLNRAQVTRALQSRIDPGRTNLIIGGLTAQLDQQSIQVAGKGNFTILGIAHRQNFIDEFNMPRSLKVLKDSLLFYQDQVAIEQSSRDILNKEEQLLQSNLKIGGANQNLTVAELKAMADFFKNRLTDIAAQRMRLDSKVKKINERILRLQNQIREQNEIYSRNTSEIVVSVSAEASTSATLEVSYLVQEAGWVPVYDLRATDTKKPVQLSYKANVFQRTGEDWTNVKMKLSTANPTLGGHKPGLAPWFIDFRQPVVVRTPKYRHDYAAAPAMMKSKIAEEDKAYDQEAGTISSHTTVMHTSVNTEFAISLPYTVRSSSRPTLVDIAVHTLNTDYIFAVAPKLDRDAFLMARITGWEEFSLLPGEASVFFEGTFVARTFIDPNEIKDTLSVSLGRDKRVVVQREKLKDFTSKKTMGANQRDSYVYSIQIRNTRTGPIKLIVEDHIPVSKNSQIEVNLTDAGQAKHNKVTGGLEWEIALQPQENKKLTYSFEVKYPKEKRIDGLQDTLF
jgi:uncharacterized protein (TIGR02231 family)